jgi:hypothetical protein
VLVLLVLGGQRLALQYRTKVRQLIAGRLEKIKTEETQEANTIHDALVLAEKLLAQHKPKDGGS